MSSTINVKPPAKHGIADADLNPVPIKVVRLEENVIPSVKKKMHAILLMYSGLGYFGMQRTPTHPTIEGELSKSLLVCSYLDDMSAESYRKVWFERASKTDKSVSALGQVCSMMLPENDDIVTKLNATLPGHIRILDVIRTTRNFSAKRSCCHRIYEYLFPTFALAPCDVAEKMPNPWTYRVSAEQLTLANTLLSRYKGTHNFFNFTSGRTADDKSCNRFIMSIECLSPFLRDDREYAVIRVAGQSFMLHQIRKMVGLMLAVIRGNTDEDVFDRAFHGQRLDIPKAPGLGLLLSRVMYSRYNKRFSHDGMHLPIDWANYEDQMLLFQQKYVYNHVDKVEVEERSMLEWLDTLVRHSYAPRLSGPPTAQQISGCEIEPTSSQNHVERLDLPVESTPCEESYSIMLGPTDIS